MTQLDDAAHETLQAIHALQEAIEDARTACTEALEEVEAQAEALDGDRAALAGDLQELEDALARLVEGLDARVAGARTALARLGGVVAATCRPGGEGEVAAAGALELEAEGLEAVATRAREVRPALEAVVAVAEAACAQSLERAAEIEAELLRSCDEAEQLSALELSAAVAATRDALSQRGERLGTVLLEVCLPRIQRARDDWDGKEALLRETLDDVFAQMRAHAETLAIEAPFAAQAVLDAATADAAAQTEECGLALLELDAAAIAQAEVVEGPDVADALAETAAKARAAAERVDSVRDRWRHAGFGS
jgi:hypothetical protein